MTWEKKHHTSQQLQHTMSECLLGPMMFMNAFQIRICYNSMNTVSLMKQTHSTHLEQKPYLSGNKASQLMLITYCQTTEAPLLKLNLCMIERVLPILLYEAKMSRNTPKENIRLSKSYSTVHPSFCCVTSCRIHHSNLKIITKLKAALTTLIQAVSLVNVTGQRSSGFLHAGNSICSFLQV